MPKKFNDTPAIILMVEDSDACARLAEEALKDGKNNNCLYRVCDGIEAMTFLHKQPPYEDVPRPDLIFLDLNMPKMDGREVLLEISKDESLARIPVVVLTTSTADIDIDESYSLHANCFISKPVDFDQFVGVIQSIEHFWFTVASLPENHQ